MCGNLLPFWYQFWDKFKPNIHIFVCLCAVFKGIFGGNIAPFQRSSLFVFQWWFVWTVPPTLLGNSRQCPLNSFHPFLGSRLETITSVRTRIFHDMIFCVFHRAHKTCKYMYFWIIMDCYLSPWRLHFGAVLYPENTTFRHLKMVHFWNVGSV